MPQLKIIENFLGYSACEDGSIWSSIKQHGHKKRTYGKYKKLKQTKSSRGYMVVTLSDKNGKQKQFLVHRIILSTFIGQPKDGQQCCHKNGDKTDNRLHNLRWDTPKKNNADKIDHGTDPIGERNPKSKLTGDCIRSIRNEYSEGNITLKELGKRHNVATPAIWKLIHRKTWNHIK